MSAGNAPVTTEARPRFTVLGVDIDALTMPRAVATLDRLVGERAGGYFVFCTVSSVLSALDQRRVAEAIREATVVTPDGMPLVWLGRRNSSVPVERVYGPDFMRAVLEGSPDVRHFLYGGAPGVAARVADVLAERYETFRLAGTYSPPMGLRAGEVDEDGVRAITEARADVVWVGLGHPKQELWMHVHRDRLGETVLAGVGAAFDFFAGTKREAPEWMKRAGLQWLHRLLSEPRRLWRRYLLGNARFVWLLARERMRR